MNRKQLLLSSAILCALGGAAWGPAVAQEATFPSKPITLVIPFPPGGATDVAPITVPAPARLSITTLWPSLSPSFLPISRPSTSVAPPGGNGITSVMGLEGKAASCAMAGANAVDPRAAQTAADKSSCLRFTAWLQTKSEKKEEKRRCSAIRPAQPARHARAAQSPGTAHRVPAGRPWSTPGGWPDATPRRCPCYAARPARRWCRSTSPGR